MYGERPKSSPPTTDARTPPVSSRQSRNAHAAARPTAANINTLYVTTGPRVSVSGDASSDTAGMAVSQMVGKPAGAQSKCVRNGSTPCPIVHGHQTNDQVMT